jgi:hypothetical protein
LAHHKQELAAILVVHCILFDLLCLMLLSAIFQLYHGDLFRWWKKLEYPERTTNYEQATGKLYHLRLQVECTIFIIYEAGHEPMSVLVMGLYEFLFLFLPCNCLLHHVEDYAMNFWTAHFS